MKKVMALLLTLLLTMGIPFAGILPAAADTPSGEGDQERGVPVASFHLISDVHTNLDTDSLDIYRAALTGMADINPDTSIAFVVTGDFTEDAMRVEYKNFYEVTAECKTVSDEGTLIMLGNHDVRGRDQRGNWVSDPTDPENGKTKMLYWDKARELYISHNQSYMPESAQTTLYHVKELGGYTFIVLNPELGLKDAMYMTEAQIAWLDETMREAYEKDPTKPIFVFSHQALNDTHWGSNVYDGFDGINRDGTPLPYQTHADAAVKAILAKYPTGIFISGHLHNNFGSVEGIIRPFASLIDVPSLVKGSIKGGGYEVEIYENEVLFRAVDFTSGTWYPQYDIAVPVGENSVPAIYQQAKKQMGLNPARFDSATADLVTQLEEMLTQTYDQTLSRGSSYHYHKEDLDAIHAVARQLKAIIDPVWGDTLALETTELQLQLRTNPTAELAAMIGADAVDNQYVRWISSDEQVATVADGKITAVSAGDVCISVVSLYDESVRADCTVFVTDPIGDAEEKIKAIPADIQLQPSCEEAISAAEQAYGALTDEQKALVNNADALTSARSAYNALLEPAEPDGDDDETVALMIAVCAGVFVSGGAALMAVRANKSGRQD